MISRSIALISLLVLATTGGAFAAASALKDPSRLALRKTDFPGGATISNRYVSGSPDARSYSVEFKYRTAGKPQELSHVVSVVKNRSLATTTFRLARNEIATLAKRVQLPAYGDEQVATFHVYDGARLIVRKNLVVWFLEWQTVIGGREMTRAEAVAEMKRYGAILKRRIGSG